MRGAAARRRTSSRARIGGPHAGPRGGGPAQRRLRLIGAPGDRRERDEWRLGARDQPGGSLVGERRVGRASGRVPDAAAHERGIVADHRIRAGIDARQRRERLLITPEPMQDQRAPHQGFGADDWILLDALILRQRLLAESPRRGVLRAKLERREAVVSRHHRGLKRGGLVVEGRPANDGDARRDQGRAWRSASGPVSDARCQRRQYASAASPR